MFCQLLLSPQVKQCAIITYEVVSGIAELLKTLGILGNIREVSKLHRMIA